MAGQMHWMEHLTDLRRRAIVAGTTWLACAALAFSLTWPRGARYPAFASQQNLASQAFDIIARDLLPANVQLVVVRPIDGFLAEMTIALALGFAVALPVVLWQIGGFVAPALKRAERRALALALLPMVALFFLGSAFAYRFVLPLLLKTLYGYGTALGAQPLLQVSEFISFTVGFMVIMGIAFQTPMAMLVLTQTGVVQAKTWAKGWRHALVIILIASAFITDPTIISQLMVAGPLVILYGFGVGLAYLTPASR